MPCRTLSRSNHPFFLSSSLKAQWSPLPPSARTGQKTQTSHVVGQIPQPYLHSRTHQADATNQKRARSLQLRPKNMLNPTADATAPPIPLLLTLRQGVVLLPLALKMRTIAQSLEPLPACLRRIRRIGIHVAARVLGQYLQKHLAVVDREPCKIADKLNCRFCNLPVFLKFTCEDERRF